jgi:prepilin-type N-terminal cleavage/methylation domain-containing protein
MWGSERMKHTGNRQTGFSLIEMMVVLAIITIIMGSVFKAIDLTQQTSRTQQVKLDLTQEAREFVDQLTHDLRNSGYPTQRNMTSGTTDPGNAAYMLVSPTAPHNAPGLIYVDNGALWFAGNLDGTPDTPGTAFVKIVRYDYVAAGPGEPNCPCLRRTEFKRSGGDPFADASAPGAAPAQLEIQGVQNGTSAANAIFTVYDGAGNAIPLPINFDSGATIAGINSLKVALTVQSPQKDNTGAYPVTTVVSSIALSNCSEALLNGATPPYCQ